MQDFSPPGTVAMQQQLQPQQHQHRHQNVDPPEPCATGDGSQPSSAQPHGAHALYTRPSYTSTGGLPSAPATPPSSPLHPAVHSYQPHTWHYPHQGTTGAPAPIPLLPPLMPQLHPYQQHHQHPQYDQQQQLHQQQQQPLHGHAVRSGGGGPPLLHSFDSSPAPPGAASHPYAASWPPAWQAQPQPQHPYQHHQALPAYHHQQQHHHAWQQQQQQEHNDPQHQQHLHQDQQPHQHQHQAHPQPQTSQPYQPICGNAPSQHTQPQENHHHHQQQQRPPPAPEPGLPPRQWCAYHILRWQAAANHILFYLVDQRYEAALAVVGTDLRFSGHFVYSTLPECPVPGSALRCTNRNRVMDWLATHGAVDAADASRLRLPPLQPHELELLESSDPLYTRPPESVLDRRYTSWREEVGVLPDGRHVKQFWMATAEPGGPLPERLVVVAEDSHRRDRRYTYKALPEFGGFVFENGNCAKEWLDFIVGKLAHPAPRSVRITQTSRRKTPPTLAAGRRVHGGFDVIAAHPSAGKDGASDAGPGASGAAPIPVMHNAASSASSASRRRSGGGSGGWSLAAAARLRAANASSGGGAAAVSTAAGTGAAVNLQQQLFPPQSKHMDLQLRPQPYPEQQPHPQPPQPHQQQQQSQQHRASVDHLAPGTWPRTPEHEPSQVHGATQGEGHGEGEEEEQDLAQWLLRSRSGSDAGAGGGGRDAGDSSGGDSGCHSRRPTLAEAVAAAAAAAAAWPYAAAATEDGVSTPVRVFSPGPVRVFSPGPVRVFSPDPVVAHEVSHTLGPGMELGLGLDWGWALEDFDPYTAPDVRAAFQRSPVLLEWVAGVPDAGSLAAFRGWAVQLSSFAAAATAASMAVAIADAGGASVGADGAHAAARQGPGGGGDTPMGDGSDLGPSCSGGGDRIGSGGGATLDSRSSCGGEKGGCSGSEGSGGGSCSAAPTEEVVLGILQALSASQVSLRLCMELSGPVTSLRGCGGGNGAVAAAAERLSVEWHSVAAAALSTATAALQAQAEGPQGCGDPMEL